VCSKVSGRWWQNHQGGERQGLIQNMVQINQAELKQAMIESIGAYQCRKQWSQRLKQPQRSRKWHRQQ
jgi:hypothetical protein